MNLPKKIPFQKFRKFVLSNLIGTLVDTFFLWIFSHYVFNSYVGKYVISPTISFEFAMLNNFLISYFWIWKDRMQRNYNEFFRKLFYYNINSAAAFLIKLGLIIFVERLTGLNVVYCNLIVLCFTGILNYIIQDKMIFRKSVPSSSSN